MKGTEILIVYHINIKSLLKMRGSGVGLEK